MDLKESITIANELIDYIIENKLHGIQLYKQNVIVDFDRGAKLNLAKPYPKDLRIFINNLCVIIEMDNPNQFRDMTSYDFIRMGLHTISSDPELAVGSITLEQAVDAFVLLGLNYLVAGEFAIFDGPKNGCDRMISENMYVNQHYEDIMIIMKKYKCKSGYN